MNSVLKLSGIALLSAFLLGGCASTKPKVELPPPGSKISDNNKGNKSYKDVLRRTNNMVQVFYGEPMVIVIDSITNMTAEQARLPADITDIVKTAFNNIGGNVRIVYDNNSEYLKKAKEVFKINGSITKYDVVYSDGSGIDVEITGTKNGQRANAGGATDSENQTVKLAINFNPSMFFGGDYIPRTSTSNEVTIEKKSKAHELAFSILGSGFGFNNSVTKSQGVHASINTLVEFSVLEVLGKLGKFPYWLLVDGGKVNSDIIAHLSGTFLREPLTRKIQMISYLFALRGADGVSTSSSVMSPSLKQAIIAYKTARGIGIDDTINKRLYKSLLEGR